MWLALRSTNTSNQSVGTPVVESKQVMDQIREMQAIVLDLPRNANWGEIYAANDDRASMYEDIPQLATD